MRARHRVRRVFWVAAATASFVAFLLTPAAQASPADVTPYTQSTPVPVQCGFTINPSAGCGQWTYWMALGAIILGLLLVGMVVFGYLRLAPGFAAAAPSAAPAPAPAPSRAPVAAVVAAAPAPAVAAPAHTETAPLAAEPEPPPVAGAEPAAAPPASAPRRAPEVEPDEATYQRVLGEQLARGVDRRMAESRARAAAVRAARAKSGS